MTARQGPYVFVNGLTIPLDAEALAAGEARLDHERGSLTEQCEGCGADLLAECELRYALVRCTACGAEYPIRNDAR